MENNLNEKQKNSRIFLNLNFEVNKSFITNSSTNGENIYYCQDIIGKKLIYDKDKQTDIDEKSRMLFRARKSKNNYYELIYPIVKFSYKDYEEISKLDNRLWYYNKNGNENEEYNLLENDIIKFGNRKYEIIKKHTSSTIPEIKNQLNEVNYKFGSIFYKFYPEYNKNNYNVCKECNKDNPSEENPKMKLCQCEKYIHYECLKNKINKKIIKVLSNKNAILYTHKFFNCSKCKSAYPYKFYINDKEYSLIDLEISENNDFIILERLNSLKEEKDGKKRNKKEILVIYLSENEIILENGIIIKYNKNSNYLTIINKNNNLPVPVLIKGNIKLELNKKIFFQTGNVYIKAECKEQDKP